MNKVYITDALRVAIYDLATRRNLMEIKKESELIYKALKYDLIKVMDGKEEILITRTIDRKIGKTYSLIKLACEYGLPIVSHKNLKRMYENEARDLFSREVTVMPVCKGGSYRGRECDIVLKDEGVSTQEVIDYFWPRRIKIVGISSVLYD